MQFTGWKQCWGSKESQLRICFTGYPWESPIQKEGTALTSEVQGGLLQQAQLPENCSRLYHMGLTRLKDCTCLATVLTPKH